MIHMPLQQMSLPRQTLDQAKRLLGFDYGDAMYHILAFDFGDDGGAIGIWKEGDDFCVRVTLDALAQFALWAKAGHPETRDIPSETADSVPMPKWWIEAANCPNCSGVGWKAIQVEAGVFEQEQCQWCFERWLALEQPAPSTRTEREYNK